MTKRIFAAILIWALLFSPFFCVNPPVAHAAETEEFYPDLTLEKGTYEEGQILVTLATPADTPLTEEGTVSFDSGITVDKTLNFGDATVLADNTAQEEYLSDKTLYVVSVSSDKYSTEELIGKLDDQAYVVSAEPDYYIKKMSVTNDTYSDYQWYLGGSDSFSDSAAAGINYSGLSQNSSSTAPIVAVVDTGVDYTHPELSDHMWKNNTSLDGVYGYDFGDGDSDPMDSDDDGHGTHCAGVIAAAANNNQGIAGVASQVQIMALKVFNTAGYCTTSNIASAFNYIYRAQQLGVSIATVNCSWGGSSTTSTMAALINKVGEGGSLFVFAAGNDGINHDNDITKTCPYDLNSPYAVVVGASTPTDERASYSDYGASTVDIFAPGYHILSTVNSPVFLPAIYSQEQRESLTSYYTDFSDQTSLLVTSEQLELNVNNSVTYKEVSHSSVDYFDKGTGSQYIAFEGGKNSNAAFYLDVTSLNLDASANYYVGLEVGMVSDGVITWEHITKERSTASSGNLREYNGHTYLFVIGFTLQNNSGNSTGVYLDNLGISKANPDTSAFGKYNIYDGTSMAAPSVSAAVAILASTYPTDTVVQRRERLITCVRTTSGMTGVCKTGGILDISKIPTATYTTQNEVKTTETKSTTKSATKKIKVKKIKLNKKKATLKYKKKLKLKATVTPKKATNKKVKWYVSNKKYASVTQKGVVKAKKKGIGHTVKVYARAKDGSKKKAYCKVKIKK